MWEAKTRRALSRNRTAPSGSLHAPRPTTIADHLEKLCDLMAMRQRAINLGYEI